MLKQALSIIALAALAACGGGGGGGSAPFAAPVAATAVAEAPSAPVAHAAIPAPVVAAQEAPQPINTNCVTTDHVSCDLIADSQPIGVGVPAGTYVVYTNRTAGYLQINSVSAFTGEKQLWSEFCVYAGTLVTGQTSPGVGEVGCSTKNPGEDYAPITWGNGTGLSVAPGGVVILNSHTEPALENHTYSMSVTVQTTGLYAWRQPQQDVVNQCNGLQQSTPWNPWQNTTGHDLTIQGADIYVAAGGSTPNDLSGAACVYVLNADGTVKTALCNDSLRTRGDVSLNLTLKPGEFVEAQATNTCSAPGLWGWVAFLQVY